MEIKKDLLYSRTHEWVKFTENETAFVGITDYAQNSLGDVVYINISQTGTKLGVGDTFGDVESIKAVSDLFSPLAGVITEVNGEAADNPSLLNSAPYETWLVKISSVSGREELLTADEYKKELDKLG